MLARHGGWADDGLYKDILLVKSPHLGSHFLEGKPFSVFLKVRSGVRDRDPFCLWSWEHHLLPLQVSHRGFSLKYISPYQTQTWTHGRRMPQPLSQENRLSVDQLLWRNFPALAGSNLSPWLVSDKPLYGKAWWCIACPASTASVSALPTVLHIHLAPVQK